MVDLPEDNREAAMNAITLPEVSLGLFLTVFEIYFIVVRLVWKFYCQSCQGCLIRFSLILIRGSVCVNNGSGSSFGSDLKSRKHFFLQKIDLLRIIFFCYLLAIYLCALNKCVVFYFRYFHGIFVDFCMNFP